MGGVALFGSGQPQCLAEKTGISLGVREAQESSVREQPLGSEVPQTGLPGREKLNRHGARACSGRWSPFALSLRRWGSSLTWRTREWILPTDSGKIPFESGGTGGWNNRVISPSLPLSFYTEFRKILSNGIVVVVIIRMPFPKNPVDFKPLNSRAHINNMEEARCLNILRLRKSRME